jgi:hypothetical protein
MARLWRERPFVPVGAGVVVGRVGTLAVALVAFHHRTKGDRKGRPYYTRSGVRGSFVV